MSAPAKDPTSGRRKTSRGGPTRPPARWRLNLPHGVASRLVGTGGGNVAVGAGARIKERPGAGREARGPRPEQGVAASRRGSGLGQPAGGARAPRRWAPVGGPKGGEEDGGADAADDNEQEDPADRG